MKARIPWKPTAEQQKSINRELHRQVVNEKNRLGTFIDAIVLWVLHEQLGFGKRRLRQFFDRFVPLLRELTEHYAADLYNDSEWLCKRKLKEIGVDIDEWENGNDDLIKTEIK